MCIMKKVEPFDPFQPHLTPSPFRPLSTPFDPFSPFSPFEPSKWGKWRVGVEWGGKGSKGGRVKWGWNGSKRSKSLCVWWKGRTLLYLEPLRPLDPLTPLTPFTPVWPLLPPFDPFPPHLTRFHHFPRLTHSKRGKYDLTHFDLSDIFIIYMKNLFFPYRSIGRTRINRKKFHNVRKIPNTLIAAIAMNICRFFILSSGNIKFYDEYFF